MLTTELLRVLAGRHSTTCRFDADDVELRAAPLIRVDLDASQRAAKLDRARRAHTGPLARVRWPPTHRTRAAHHGPPLLRVATLRSRARDARSREGRRGPCSGPWSSQNCVPTHQIFYALGAGSPTARAVGTSRGRAGGGSVCGGKAWRGAAWWGGRRRATAAGAQPPPQRRSGGWRQQRAGAARGAAAAAGDRRARRRRARAATAVRGGGGGGGSSGGGSDSSGGSGTRRRAPARRWSTARWTHMACEPSPSPSSASRRPPARASRQGRHLDDRPVGGGGRCRRNRRRRHREIKAREHAPCSRRAPAARLLRPNSAWPLAYTRRPTAHLFRRVGRAVARVRRFARKNAEAVHFSRPVGVFGVGASAFAAFSAPTSRLVNTTQVRRETRRRPCESESCELHDVVVVDRGSWIGVPAGITWYTALSAVGH